jgi:hypothetical protein
MKKSAQLEFKFIFSSYESHIGSYYFKKKNAWLSFNSMFVFHFRFFFFKTSNTLYCFRE